MNPEQLRYCKTHEWVHVDDAGLATVGISAFAVEQLTDVVGLELPEVGAKFEAGDEFGTAESVKAVSPLYAPLSGEVVAVNSQLQDNLEAFNDDPYGAAWIIKLQTSGDGDAELLDHAAYQKQCAEEG